ncbi:MAG: biosynthetic-type acetolactate synthase large subunit [Lachnospiraceae bacterium]|jgi:acetolactate synthase-1/2/3 large subunit|nr:biosynthetic-type acetolactate synthase large subunit [Lachnospiraceae bacterium]
MIKRVLNGADALVRSLEEENVEYVFGYPGVAICPFFNSILNSDIKTVLVRQEQCAAHAASGYTRVSGKPGVVAVTSGPGATNLITGIATAFADSIPLVCITGQVDSRLMGSDVFQEADISGACESFVKFSYIVRQASDIPRIVREAFHIASTGRKGPVLIDIPHDVQMDRVSGFAYPVSVNLRTYKPTVEGHPVQIKRVMRELARAKRPIICVGGGVHLSDAAEEVRKFAEAHDIPVVSTMMGLSAFPTDHPLFYGMVGNNGQKYGNRAMNEADMIIMVGARVADRSISQPDLITENKVLAHIDVDPAEIGKNAGPSIPLVGDIKHIFREFNERDLEVDYSDWLDWLDGCKDDVINTESKKRAEIQEEHILQGRKDYVDPRIFIRKLSLKMDKDAVYVADVGQNQIWSCANAVMRRGRFLTSGGMGTMGYAVPAAMGAKISSPDRQVVAVCGEGGFQMTMQELATIVQYEVPVKIVVLRNNVLGMVRQHQHFVYHDRFSVTDLSTVPDLDKLAEAYHIGYLRLETNEGMNECLDAFLKEDKTMLLEVMIDPDDLC